MQFLEYLAIWSKNLKACFKKTFAVKNKSNMIEKANEDEEVGVGVVDGLFEMYKLRESIAKARA